MELLDDEPARGHALVSGFHGGSVAVCLSAVPSGLRPGELADSSLPHVRHECSGRLHPARPRDGIGETLHHPELPGMVRLGEFRALFLDHLAHRPPSGEESDPFETIRGNCLPGSNGCQELIDRGVQTFGLL
jgi:hypothetical protein